MRIQRIGFTPIKGGRHLPHETVELAPGGPVGDREFAVVDLARLRVLRTVENPGLLACSARWANGVLCVELAGETHTAAPVATGERLELEYWGRTAAVELVHGPWAAAFSAHLGREVALARTVRAGEVVYGAPVSLVTTGALRRLGEIVGQAVDAARFRATLVVDSGDLPPHVEDSWAGRMLRVGSATLRVLGPIDRCAVIDADPLTGAPGSRLLKALAGYRLRESAIDFGVYAEVVLPGRVSSGDAVALEPA
jgi:uncharacterized protein YcbX